LLGSLLALVLLVILIKRLLPILTTYRLKGISFVDEEKKYSLNILITNSVIALGRHGDKIVLVYFLSTFELGIYSVVLTIATFIPLVLTSVNSIFSPIISQLHSQNKLDDLAHYFQLSGRYVFTLSFPLMVFIFIYSKPIMSVFGSDFIQGSGLLLFIIIGQFINVSMGSVGLMLQMCGLEKPLRNISIMTSFISFALYFILINEWGLVGLGLVYALNMLMFNGACAFVLKKNLNIQLYHAAYAKVIALFCALFIPIYYIADGLNVTTTPLFLCYAFLVLYVLYMSFWFIFFGKKEFPQILKTVNFKF
jgi:O-antigen/teichoic acid export membrane protein